MRMDVILSKIIKNLKQKWGTFFMATNMGGTVSIFKIEIP